MTEGKGSIAGEGPRDTSARGNPRGVTGAIVWFTGLPSSGKSTLARRVQGHFSSTGRASVLLDGDELRDILGVHSYTPEDRDRFYRALGALAALIAHQGIVVLVAATAPRRQERDRVRAAVAGEAGFVEVWVQTPLEACEERDPKGLYARARRGELPDLPGVGAAYEPPLEPEVIADGGLDESAVVAIECQLERPDIA
ncbi:MAG TPA: adenylyl-sulfate kinase [Kofleriaceae bacterium]|nr:adenylyl-sulfate kinase [Kofleriaceae bacterium]